MISEKQLAKPKIFAAAAGAMLIVLTVAQATAGLVGHWEFDNPADVGKATVSDDLETSGSGISYAAAGRVGGALSLGGNGYLRVDSSHTLASGLPTGDTSFTIAAFLQTSKNSRNTIAFWGNFTSAQANGFRTTTSNELGIIGNSTGGLLNFGWGSGFDYGIGAGGTPPGTIYDGQWHHVAVTYDSGTATKRLFFDGVEIGTGKVIPDLNVAAENFGIGSRTGSEAFNGLLDDVRIYDNALSVAELSALASAGGGPDTIAPVIASLSPSHGAAEVAISSKLMAIFHELVLPGMGSITLKRASDDSTVEIFDVPSASVTIDGSEVSVAISDLAYETGYYVIITAGAFTDLSGNDHAGITDETTWAFTTAPPFGPLSVTKNGANLEFKWPSTLEKLYTLGSNPGLTSSPTTWSPHNDGVIIHENMASSGTGTNTLTIPNPGDPKHFFSIKEFSAEIDVKTLAAWSAPYRNWHYQPNHVIPSSPNIPGYAEVSKTDVPTVFQLPEDPKWYMTFVGFDGNGYRSFIAESDDLVNWTNRRLAMDYGPEGAFDYGGVVLGAYLYESYDIKAARILKLKDDKFWSLYGAYPFQGGYELLPGYNGLASSNDGITWERVQNDPILSIYDSDRGTWENASIYMPWLVEYNGVYYNHYNAKGGPEQIGMTVSSDLLTWSRYENNPVIPVTPGGYNSSFSADAKIFRDGDHWVCFFFGVGKGGAHIMAAFSWDLYNWTVDPNPLYLAGGNPSGLDSQYAHKISLVWNPENETYYMYYNAVGNQGRGIGLITSKPLGD